MLQRIHVRAHDLSAYYVVNHVTLITEVPIVRFSFAHMEMRGPT